MKRFFSFHFALCLFLASTHTIACWQLTGGSKGFFSPFPILNDDHTFNYYYANLTQHFLLKTGTTAGYDPHFMAGYAKSILFPSSSTLPEVLLFISAGKYSAQVFKGYVFVAIAILPWLMWISGEYLFRHPTNGRIVVKYNGVQYGFKQEPQLFHCRLFCLNPIFGLTGE